MPQCFALEAMRARFELVLEGGRDATALAELAFEEVSEVERRWSRFREDSLLAHLERTGELDLDEDGVALFTVAHEQRLWSSGAFDATLGSGGIELDPERGAVRLIGDDTRLDLGGVAKGHALDLAARALREEGVEVALLHAGTSTVVALGAPEDAEGWRMRVTPERDAPVALLRDAVLSVSSTAAGGAGEGLHHLVHPDTGAPVHTARTAAVAAPIDAADTGQVPTSAALADAVSTALALDPHCMPDGARRRGLSPIELAVREARGWRIHSLGGAQHDSLFRLTPADDPR